MDNAAAFNRQIIFPDNYSVAITADRLTVKSGASVLNCDPLFLGEVGEDSPMFERIRNAGRDASDYLTDHIIFVRAGNGVRQAVSDVKERKRSEMRIKNRRREHGLVNFFNQEINFKGAI